MADVVLKRHCKLLSFFTIIEIKCFKRSIIYNTLDCYCSFFCHSFSFDCVRRHSSSVHLNDDKDNDNDDDDDDDDGGGGGGGGGKVV